MILIHIYQTTKFLDLFFINNFNNFLQVPGLDKRIKIDTSNKRINPNAARKPVAPAVSRPRPQAAASPVQEAPVPQDQRTQPARRPARPAAGAQNGIRRRYVYCDFIVNICFL